MHNKGMLPVERASQCMWVSSICRLSKCSSCYAGAAVTVAGLVQRCSIMAERQITQGIQCSGSNSPEYIMLNSLWPVTAAEYAAAACAAVEPSLIIFLFIATCIAPAFGVISLLSPLTLAFSALLNPPHCAAGGAVVCCRIWPEHVCCMSVCCCLSLSVSPCVCVTVHVHCSQLIALSTFSHCMCEWSC